MPIVPLASRPAGKLPSPEPEEVVAVVFEEVEIVLVVEDRGRIAALALQEPVVLEDPPGVGAYEENRPAGVVGEPSGVGVELSQGASGRLAGLDGGGQETETEDREERTSGVCPGGEP
jgi:hypothetical protein